MNAQVIKGQALINALISQRNAAWNEAANLAAENAALQARIKELETPKETTEAKE